MDTTSAYGASGDGGASDFFSGGDAISASSDWGGLDFTSGLGASWILSAVFSHFPSCSTFPARASRSRRCPRRICSSTWPTDGYAQHTAWAAAWQWRARLRSVGRAGDAGRPGRTSRCGIRRQDRHAGARGCVRHEPRWRAEFERFLLEQFP